MMWKSTYYTLQRLSCSEGQTMTHRTTIVAILMTMSVIVMIYTQILFSYYSAHSLPKDLQDVTGLHDRFHVKADPGYSAEELYYMVRVLCLVPTSKDNFRTRADHVMATWGKRCNKILFVTAEDDHTLPILKIQAMEGRRHLMAKTTQAFDLAYKYHLNGTDWFLKADDDTYVIMENLRHMLSNYSASEPRIFGQHFRSSRDNEKNDAFFSGGAGYVISRQALRKFGERQADQCESDGGQEDVRFYRCLAKLGVIPGDSRDALGKSRFHCCAISNIVIGHLPNFYIHHEYFGAKKGMNSISDYPISFHPVSNDSLYAMEYLVYRVRSFGVRLYNADMNR